MLYRGSILIVKRTSPSGFVVVKEVGNIFVIISWMIDAVVADYTLTLLMDLNSDGEITLLPFQPVWKIVKKSFKHRIYVKFAITKVSLLKAGFAPNGLKNS